MVECYYVLLWRQGREPDLEFAFLFPITEKLTYSTEHLLLILSAKHTDERAWRRAHAQLPMLHVFLIKWQLALLRPPRSLYDSLDTSWQISFFFLQLLTIQQKLRWDISVMSRCLMSLSKWSILIQYPLQNVEQHPPLVWKLNWKYWIR